MSEQNEIEEVIEGYVVTKKLKSIWRSELIILQEFMRVCRKNNLKFFVAHGTLLGAVRHKGFIPWDDDVDINMPRRDYDKLLKIGASEFKEPFFLQSFETDKNSFFGYAALKCSTGTGVALQDIGGKCNSGIYIDIFPMDGVFEDDVMRKKQAKKIEKYRWLLYAKVYGKRLRYLHKCSYIKWQMLKVLSKMYSSDELYKRFNQACQACTYEEAQRLGIHAFKTEYECCYWYKEDFEELVELPFENIMVPAPKNYDRCLKIKWNNYMEFPKKEQRGHKHNDVIIDADIPYTQYDFSKFTDMLVGDSNKKIYLFGAGEIFKEYVKLYGKQTEPVAVFDNDESKWGSSVMGVRIINPEEIKSLNLKDIKIIITSIYFKEIEQQLINYGVNNYYIYLRGRKYRR